MIHAGLPMYLLGKDYAAAKLQGLIQDLNLTGTQCKHVL